MTLVRSMSCPPCFLICWFTGLSTLCYVVRNLRWRVILELSVYLKGQDVICYLPFGRRVGVPFNINIDITCNTAAHNMAPLPLDGRGSAGALSWRP